MFCIISYNETGYFTKYYLLHVWKQSNCSFYQLANNSWQFLFNTNYTYLEKIIYTHHLFTVFKILFCMQPNIYTVHLYTSSFINKTPSLFKVFFVLYILSFSTAVNYLVNKFVCLLLFFINVKCFHSFDDVYLYSLLLSKLS